MRCAGCGFEIVGSEKLSEIERTPCPQCGSLGLVLVRVQSDMVEVNDRHRMKLKGVVRTASGKPSRELTQGHDFHRISGVWNYLYRLIDRMNNWYHEKITEPKTNKTIHERQEPLSNHRGHGSAKHSKKGI